MAQALQGSAQLAEFSTDNSTWKSLVCLKTFTHTSEGSTSPEETACGVFVGVGLPKHSWSAEGVVDGARNSTTDVTYKDVLYWLDNGTALYYRFKNIASGSVTAGLAWQISAACLISKVQLKSQVGQVITFTIDVQAQGALTQTYN